MAGELKQGSLFPDDNGEGKPALWEFPPMLLYLVVVY
jgi:hypothetical protein